MVWSSLSPDGTKSVATNTPIMAANTAYTEATMNVDHFWNIGVDQDGHHQFVQMPAYELGGNPADPTLATGMDGVVYFKTVSATVSEVELFRNTSNGVLQISPTLITNTLTIGSSYVTIATVPNNTYGQIFIIDPSGAGFNTWGFFIANNNTVYSFTNVTVYAVSSTPTYAFKFDNGGGSGLQIRVESNNAPTGTYNTKVLFWGI